MTPQEYFQEIGKIVGDDASDGEISLQLSRRDYPNTKALLTRIRIMQKELRLLKKDVGSTISSLKSEFITARTNVGKGFAAGLASGLFGQRAVASVNTVRRDELRRAQIDAVAPYEKVGNAIDQLLHQLDLYKGKIELEKEKSDLEPSNSDTSAAAVPPSKRFFAYLNEQVKGPYSLEQLRALHDVATISRDTQCCLEGTETWRAYGAIISE